MSDVIIMSINSCHHLASMFTLSLHPQMNQGERTNYYYLLLIVIIVCVFFPFILDIKFDGRTSRGHTGGRSHRISHPPSFCGACLNFSREMKDSAIPFPRQP